MVANSFLEIIISKDSCVTYVPSFNFLEYISEALSMGVSLKQSSLIERGYTLKLKSLTKQTLL